ncbi:hypothetical protein GW17_00045152 [Ensete ventricosum]|nr:hypothetical protein GW17_00045152 [Ensete ventricosum]
MVSLKNVTVINFAQCCTYDRHVFGTRYHFQLRWLFGFYRRTPSLSIRMTLARDLSEQAHMAYSSHDTESE